MPLNFHEDVHRFEPVRPSRPSWDGLLRADTKADGIYLE
jgi:hypothetical protein